MSHGLVLECPQSGVVKRVILVVVWSESADQVLSWVKQVILPTVRKRAGWTKLITDSRKIVMVKFAADSTMATSASLPVLAEVIWEMSV